jgi:hypothetical protein
MDRWEIRPTQTPDDPDRHTLLIRGGPADVAALVKKFGALLGRPTPFLGEDFNLSLVVHRLTPEIRERLETWLKEAVPATRPVEEAVSSLSAAMTSPSAAAEPASAPAPVPVPIPAPPEPQIPPPIRLEMPPLAAPSAPEAAPPVPAEVPIPPMPEPAATAPAPAPTTIPPLPEVKPPTVEMKPPVPEMPPLISLTPAPAASDALPPNDPLASMPTLAPPPAAAAPSEPAATPPPPEPAAPALPASAPPPATPPPEPPFLMPLRAAWTMETLIVGAYNRFAHAAATQVIASPGTMYNPLYLYGVPGTGKSHLLHAIARSLSKGLDGVGLFSTTGPRLSRGVNAGLAAKNLAEIEKKAADSKAFLIDDIHLMAVSEQNKDALAKIFKTFFDRQQQVVITSLYPPRALGALEEALKFSFSKGWSVDLKIPNPAAQKDLISFAADHAGSKLSIEEVGMLHEKLSQWGYQDLTLWLRRLVAFKELREAAGQPASVSDMLPLIYEPVLAGIGEPPKTGAPFQPPPAQAGAAPLAVIVPKDQLVMSTFAAAQFHEVGAKFGLRQSYRHALWESYDAQQPFGVPFLIGDLCHRAGVTRALIVGPTPDSPLGPRSAEFAHAVRRILENIGVEMGWIPFSGLTTAAHYLNAHLDFVSAPRAP